VIRYNRLGYLALNVTDLDKSEDFYTRVVGLQGSEERCLRHRFLRCSDKHHDIALYKSDKPGLKRVGFELESEESLRELKASLDAEGMPYVDIPKEDAEAMHTYGGIRSLEPVTRCTLDFYLSMDRAPTEFQPTVAKIQRLGHFVLRSADYEASVHYMTDVLNFKVSDSIEGAVTFLRCFPNPYHHSMGIGNGKGKSGFHHVNFMVTEVDDIGKGIWRLKKGGVPIVDGPGRHLPSGSMFLYYLDPDGLTVEYSFGMETFDEKEARDPRTLPPVRESFDLWLGTPDPRKSAVGDIEPAQLAR
jgi:2,3-dihydroxy-p-cumate/2,3-dihydroxybenzoate 3,4-dioxygenase